MKQRLGLAQSLLHNPDLIILDEPTTGLDPQGMKEVRDLILFLSNQKKTIFISSHILYEIELIANRMVIIDKGSAIVEGNVSDLLNANNLKVTFEVNDIEKTKNVLTNSSWIDKIESSSKKGKIVFSLTNNEIPQLNRYLVENKIEVSSVVPTRSLEQYFLNITEKGKN
jgi:ABC-type multidrug transport system ATPase subunit